MDHSHRLVHKFLINIIVNLIRRKADNVTSCSRSDLISIFKLTAFCSKFNSFSVSKRRLVNQSVRKLVQSFTIKNDRNGISAACYIHPSIQICRSVKHGFGVSVLVNSPSVQAGEVLVREDPLVEVEENECKLLLSERNDTSVKDHQFIIRKALTTLAPFQDHHTSFISNDKENDDDCAEEKEKRNIEQQIIESNVMRYRNVDFSIAGDQDEDDDENEEDCTQRNNAKRGIFFFSSRFNHSCQPNALCVFSDISDSSSSSRLTIVALREIKANEEIVISYSNPLASRVEKMRKMGFECCTNSSLLVNSDSTINSSACNLVDCVKESGKENENEKKKLAEYVAHEIDQLLTNARKYIRQDNKPTMALKYLLGYLKRTPKFKKLTACHFLRFRLYQEILAAAVGVVSNLNDLEELINDVAHPLLENAKKVLPEKWPTLSGFEMHLAYLLALKMRFKQQHHQEDKNLAETAKFVDWWKRTDKESYDRVQNLIEKSKERHEVIFGDEEETGGTRWKKFEERFEMELDCCLGE